MSAFTANDFNATEKSWLDEVCAALQRREGAAPATLAEIGNLCPRSKNVKSKCRKVTALIEGDSRFNLLEGDMVELNPSAKDAASASAEDTTAAESKSTPHASFLLYMSALPEEDVVDSEQHHHLEKHYTVWRLSEDAQRHAGIEELHFTEVLDSLKKDNKVHVHDKSSRLVLETYAGRIEARLAALSGSAPALDCASGEQPPESAGDAQPGAYSNITGTNYKNVRFLDFDDFELSMFGDTGVGHGYVVRGPNYMQDNEKIDTGKIHRLRC